MSGCFFGMYICSHIAVTQFVVTSVYMEALEKIICQKYIREIAFSVCANGIYTCRC